MIERHWRYTSSPRAEAILAQWSLYRSRFVKVMPVEYRRALQMMQARTRATERPEVSVAVGA
jgi:glutamate synthase (NADPH/NADH) large chain